MSYGPQIKEMRKRGYAIKEIAKKIGCAISTVSYHCKNVQVENIQRLQKHKRIVNQQNSKIGSEANAKIWEEKRKDARDEAIKEWPKMKKDPEFMGFLGLYWGEGSKSNRDVVIGNNDPGIILAALKQFKKLSSNRISAHVYHYPNHDPKLCARYWGKLLDIKVSTSQKSWIGKKRKTASRFGLCRVRVGDYRLYQKLITWIKIWGEELRTVA